MRYLLTFIFYALVATGTDAQTGRTSTFQPIRTFKEKDTTKACCFYRTKIAFYDSLSKQPIKTIDLVEMNPFGKFREKVANIWDDFSTPVYELDTTRVIDMIDSIELVSKNHHYKTPKLTPFRLMSLYFVSTQGRNFVAVLYELATFNKSGRNISSHSTILIFDRKGKLVKKTPVWDVNGDRPVISDDGRFVLFKCGGPYGWEQAGYVPNQLRVYDTERNVMYIDTEVDIGGTTDLIQGKYFNTSIFYGDRTSDVIIYDLYEKIKYKRRFSFEEMPFLHSVDREGFKFAKPSGEIYLKYSLENDFTKSKINLSI